MCKRILLALVLILLAGHASASNYGPSSVNPNVPANNSPLTSSVVRNNFLASYNDINNIYSILNAFSQPSVTWPTSGDVVVSNGTSAPNGIAPSGTDCLVSSSGSWAALPCSSAPTGTAGGDLGGSYPNPTVISVADVVNGTLPIANGGTGAGSATAAANNILPSQSGKNGDVLTTNGTNTSWISVPGVSIITLSGDVSGSGTNAITTTVNAVNGVTYNASPSTNTVAVVTGSNVTTYEQVPNTALANSSITLGGVTVSLGGSQSIACGNLSNSGTACQASTGTSGATLGLLNGNLTFGGNDTFSNTITGNISGNAGTVTTIPSLSGVVTTTGSSNVTSFGSFSSATLAAALTNETGSGFVVFSTSPLLTTPEILGSSTGYTTVASANAGATDYTVTLPANTGTVAETNLAQTYTAAQTFDNSDILLLGSSTGTTTLSSANSTSTSYTLTLPAITDTVTTNTATQTLTNKSIAGSEINSGTVSATYLPTGSSSALGVLECGTGTSCSAGVISVSDVSSFSAGSTGLTPSSATTGAITLGGTLGAGYGGTGQTSLSAANSALYETVATTLGDLVYGGASGAPTRLAGNTSTSPEFYTSTGTGSAAQAIALTSSTGSGNVVLATSPTLTTPALGTPSAIVLTNATGTASSLNIGGSAPAGSLTGSTLASGVTSSSLTSVGTIGTGTWQGTLISPTYGGTGVNNGSSTITVGGNTTFSGAHTFTGTLTGNTSVTFPTSGTLSTTTGTVTSIATTSPITGGTITSTGTIACGTCATTTNGGALSGTSPVAVSAGGAISITGAAGQVLAGASPAFTATPTLGASGTLGSLTMGNATSGTITLEPATGALSTITEYLPISSGDTLAGIAATQTLTNKSIAGSEINSSTVGVTYGGTGANLSSTGGTSQVLQQTSTGANVTVGQLAASNLSNGTTGSGSVVLAASPIITGTLTASGSISATGSSSPQIEISYANSGATDGFEILNNSTSSSTTSQVLLETGTSSAGLELNQVDGTTPAAYVESLSGDTGGLILNTEGADTLTFETDNANRAQIDGSGNFYIGTTTQLDSSLATISASSGRTLAVNTATGTNGVAITVENTTVSSGSYYVLIAEYGSGHTGVGSITTTSSTTSYNTSSDQRIKTNIAPLPVTNANGNVIDQLQPVTYNFIQAYDPNQSQGEGFIAQQLNAVIPYAVTPGDTTDQNYTPDDGVFRIWQIDEAKIVAQLVADLQWVHTVIKPLASGVSCSGAPSAQFTVTNGIVTHC